MSARDEQRPKVMPKASLSPSRYVGETIADELLIEKLCDKLRETGDEKFVRNLFECLKPKAKDIVRSEIFRRYKRRLELIDEREVSEGFESRLTKHQTNLDSQDFSKSS